ncbi:hypothetical protein QJS10_CPA06g00276 [Acorus calamus]|uniref:Uncharacterized protein n=1 Tax=Acorus calamus TaxID=4465 RepID=A0AAV9EK03_ACOCL|nr:hypothetical protein QJS10_CPA06g00276 [Acorus calamus]
MADQSKTTTKKNLKRSLSERLQMKAPSSIQVRPASQQVQEWKVAIPLLSPLCGSPTSPRFGDRTAEREQQRSRSAEPTSYQERTWQRTAEIFCYEPSAAAKMVVPAFFIPNLFQDTGTNEDVNSFEFLEGFQRLLRAPTDKRVQLSILAFID